QLRGLAAWLTEPQVEEGVMESTAQYWKPVWETLERYWQPLRRQMEGCGPMRGKLHLAEGQSNRGAGAGRGAGPAIGERASVLAATAPGCRAAAGGGTRAGSGFRAADHRRSGPHRGHVSLGEMSGFLGRDVPWSRGERGSQQEQPTPQGEWRSGPLA